MNINRVNDFDACERFCFSAFIVQASRSYLEFRRMTATEKEIQTRGAHSNAIEISQFNLWDTPELLSTRLSAYQEAPTCALSTIQFDTKTATSTSPSTFDKDII